MKPDDSSPSHSRGLLLMLLSTACFTGNVLLVRALAAMHDITVWQIVTARFVMGLVLVIALYPRDIELSHLVINRRLAVRGISGGLGVYLLYLTVAKLGAGRAVFINNSYAIWGALLAAWLLREKLTAGVLAGSVAALGGLALLTNAFSSRVPPGLYDGIAVLGAVLSGYIVVTIRQLHAKEHTSTIFAAQCLYGLLLSAGPAVATGGSPAPVALALLALAGLLAGSGQIAMTLGFRDLTVAGGSLLQMLVPIGTAIGGVLFFHERPSAHEIAGAGLIVAGTVFTARTTRAKPADSIPTLQNGQPVRADWISREVAKPRRKTSV